MAEDNQQNMAMKGGSGGTASPPRVLAYGPYAAWQLHGLWEMTLLHGLRVRGADVAYVLCDGLYSDCDMHWKATAPRTPQSCINCQARSTAIASQMGMDFRWLGRYITPEQQRQAHAWAASVPRDELPTCTYGDYEIGAWVRSSVHSHLRIFTLDLDNAEVERTYRSYAASGLIAAIALSALYDDVAPEILLILSGRFSSTNVAIQIAQQRGIRVVAHERGIIRENIILNHGPTRDISVFHKVWEDWGEVPLDEAEMQQILAFLEDRRKAKWQSWHAFSPPAAEESELLAKLNLTGDRPLFAAFLSSDDESADNVERNKPFGIQDAWIEATVAWAAQHPEIDLVLRAHPNIRGRFLGENRRQVELLRDLNKRLPVNARLIMPEDEVSSYTLMDAATVGLVFRSTAGLEMATLGKPVVVAAGGYYTGLPFVQTVSSTEDYPRMLDHLLATPVKQRSPEIQVAALRFAHGAFIKRNIPFPLIRMNDPHTGSLAFQTLDELLPGRDAGLDRACRIILQGEPIVLPPTPEQQRRDPNVELQMLGWLEEESAVTEPDTGDYPPEVAEAWKLAERGLERAAIARLERLAANPMLMPAAKAALKRVHRARETNEA